MIGFAIDLRHSFVGVLELPARLVHVIERRTPRRSTGQSVATNKHESASGGILAHDPPPKPQRNVRFGAVLRQWPPPFLRRFATGSK
jgi:hypothetical protein